MARLCAVSISHESLQMHRAEIHNAQWHVRDMRISSNKKPAKGQKSAAVQYRIATMSKYIC